ncbi:hypothetical protein BVI1335_1060030 [Burkholderia vietnamiensis]|nr:hypothetical protein BVI1335_1060030 [Burkholderia vietnamiensis]
MARRPRRADRRAGQRIQRRVVPGRLTFQGPPGPSTTDAACPPPRGQARFRTLPRPFPLPPFGAIPAPRSHSSAEIGC